MTTDNLINLIAAILIGGGTLALALMTWKSIRQTRNIQKSERRESLLNEIIEWAKDISSCGIEKGYPDISNLIDLYSVWSKVSDNISDIVLSFKGMRGENQYIGEIVKTLDQDLQEAVKILKDDFEEHIKLLSLCETYMRDREKAWEKVVGYKHKLNFSAKKVVEEAVKIKTRDIGKEEENMSKEGEATGGKEPTLKDIEKHLKQQDKQMTRGSYTTGAAVGAAIILVAVSLWIGRTVLSADAFYWTYIFLLICGFGFMSWCRYKQRKIKG